MTSTSRPGRHPNPPARFRAAVDWLFDGEVSPWICATLRVGLGVLFLVRHSDWLRPWVPFEHHRWVHGLEFVESRPNGPFLSSPFVPFLALGEGTTRALAVARTALAVLFVAGVWPRLAALLLSLVSYALLASDRYHYLHHLHLLYSSIAWLSLAPLGDRLSLERVVRRALGGRRDDMASPLVAPTTSPIWPLQLLRALVLSVYAASGLSKLTGPWLRGDTLRDLHDLGVVGGRLWTLGEQVLGAATIARGVCAIELALPLLLMVPRTRRAGIALGWALHAAIGGVMGVSTFGAEMAILLLAFWQTEETRARGAVHGDAPRQWSKERVMVGMADLTSDQRAQIGAYWWQRAEGEFTSWVGFQHVLEDLRVEGSPGPILALAERAVRDERRHALWCREWAEHFGHARDELRPRSESAITFRGATDAENRLLRIALCCLTESVGCFVLRQARPAIEDAALRKQSQQHLADELQHSRVGWGHLSTLDERRRECLRGWMPKLLQVLPGLCCDGPEQDAEELVPFGYFTPRLLRAAYDEAMREVVLPGLEHLNLGAHGHGRAA